jgi:hypothetical protein
MSSTEVSTKRGHRSRFHGFFGEVSFLFISAAFKPKDQFVSV